MASESKLISFLEQLRKNSRINKHQHFHAADRNQFYNNIFGTIAVVINVLLSSLLFVTITENLPDIAKWVSAFMAVVAAGCGAVQTFFNFQKVFEGHRKAANSYLEIQRECERILAMFADNMISSELLAKEIEIINKSYIKANNDAEVFPVGDGDHRKAMGYEMNKNNETMQKQWDQVLQ